MGDLIAEERLLPRGVNDRSAQPQLIRGRDIANGIDTWVSSSEGDWEGPRIVASLILELHILQRNLQS